MWMKIRFFNPSLTCYIIPFYKTMGTLASWNLWLNFLLAVEFTLGVMSVKVCVPFCAEKCVLYLSNTICTKTLEVALTHYSWSCVNLKKNYLMRSFCFKYIIQGIPKQRSTLGRIMVYDKSALPGADDCVGSPRNYKRGNMDHRHF